MASSSLSFSILLPLKNFSRAPATPSLNSPLSQKIASRFLASRSPFPSNRTLPSKQQTSNLPTSSPNFPAPIPNSKTNSSSSPPISTTSASAPPSTATISTTAPWTTPPEAPSSSTSLQTSKPI